MQLHTIDLLVITAYMAGVTAFGWYFGRKQKDIRDYFLSDREVPWWALAGSIVATETSTVTFRHRVSNHPLHISGRHVGCDMDRCRPVGNLRGRGPCCGANPAHSDTWRLE